MERDTGEAGYWTPITALNEILDTHWCLNAGRPLLAVLADQKVGVHELNN